MVTAGAGSSAAWATPTSVAESQMRSVSANAATSHSVVSLPTAHVRISTTNKQTAPSATAPIAHVPTKKLSCVDNALSMAQPLLDSIATPGNAKARGVAEVVAKIKAQSASCASALFADGTATHPNAGLLTGSGFSFTAQTCVGTSPCVGGNAGALFGTGGNGFNGGRGGDAGWYGGIAGNGGNAATLNCSAATCVGGNGGRAGRYGRGGRGGDGAPGNAGGFGGVGGLIGGAGG